jgi:hypothetical protein
MVHVRLDRVDTRRLSIRRKCLLQSFRPSRSDQDGAAAGQRGRPNLRVVDVRYLGGPTEAIRCVEEAPVVILRAAQVGPQVGAEGV